MFEKAKPFSGFSVDDLAAAKKFYGETLGVRVAELAGGGLLELQVRGERSTLIYPKPDHTPASFTILNFRAREPAGQPGGHPGSGLVHWAVCTVVSRSRRTW